MRRLLAKPAPPYARTTYGSGSESEGPTLASTGYHSFSDGGGSRERERRERRQRDVAGEAVRAAFDRGGLLDLDLDLDLGVPLHTRSRSRTRSEPRHAPELEPGREKEKEKRQRNVLRRKPSSTHPRPQATRSTSTTAPSSPLAAPSPPLHSPLPPLSPRSPLTPSILPLGSPRPDSAGSAKGVGMLRALNASTSSLPHAVSPTRSRSRSTSRQRPTQHEHLRQASTPALLTPAAAVVAAYKRQTALQDAVEAAVAGDYDHDRASGSGGVVTQGQRHSTSAHPHPTSPPSSYQSHPPPSSTHTPMPGHQSPSPKTHKHSLGRAAGASLSREEGGGASHFTVFGSPQGRVVAVGVPEGHHYSQSQSHSSWDVSASTGLGRRSTTVAVGLEGGSGGAGGALRTLTRKMSGRLRRSVERDRERERERKKELEKELEKGEARRGASMSVDRDVGRQREMMARGRPSLQERRVVSGREGIKSTGAGKRTMAVASDLGHGHANRRSLRLSIDMFPEEIRALRRDRDREMEGTATKSTGSPVNSGTPSPSPSAASGGKIWKLVKRISTGGLREKYAAEEAPPVPALPKEYSASPIRSAEIASGSSHGFSKSVRRKASMVLGVTSSPSTPSKSPSHSYPRSPLPTSTVPVRPSPPTSNARKSTTTRSSSPNSSDVASARFFSRQNASAHSSASSLPLEDVPPMPKLNKGVGHHIIPPSELGRMYSDEGHGGSEESQPSQSRSRSHQSHSSVLPSNPPTTPSRSHTHTSNPLKKLKLVLPGTPSPTKSPSQQQPRTSDDWMIVHTPAMVLASLPLPPRRGTRPVVQHQGGDEHEDQWERAWGGKESNTLDQDDSRAPSPMIPSFSTAAPINAFPPKRASTDVQRSRPSPIATTPPSIPPIQRPTVQFDSAGTSPQGLPPPPRPSRSTQRPSPGRSLSTPTSPIKSKPPSSRVPVPPYDPNGAATPRIPTFPTTLAPNPSRRSTGGHSTTSTATITHAHARRRSSSYISSVASSPPSSPPPPGREMTFREIGRNPAGAALSEQEKAARWDDLLERSAKAGGTLHLDMGGRSGEHGLRSDRLRFSEISEVTSL
ncbi:hypothetical protein DXG03_000633 [Asterophora parasitica]|uniref:Uncharacterized protein n=1 Tax=Asterophora parasitica TaxID=117018 RepID=A0A9P7G6A7_9AGAR|nr:hypothetical protein DXG03_000633 [Asterophora parasitica]